MGEVLDLGVKQGLVDKSGAWYAYQGNKIGQGRANAAQFLEEHSDVATEIELKVREALLTGASANTAANAETTETDDAYPDALLMDEA